MRNLVLVVIASIFLSGCAITGLLRPVPIVAPAELMKPPPELKPIHAPKAEKNPDN